MRRSIYGANERDLINVYEKVKIDLVEMVDNLEKAEKEASVFIAGLVKKYDSLLPILALINYISEFSKNCKQISSKDVSFDSIGKAVFDMEYQHVLEKSIISSLITK